jgi:hypothetical protein
LNRQMSLHVKAPWIAKSNIYEHSIADKDM